jgi:NAD(P)H-quinone oxidoreductase subunit N
VRCNGCSPNWAISTAELNSLVALCKREPRLKIVVEMGGARALRWKPLAEVAAG